MATIEQQNTGEPPKIVLTYDSGDVEVATLESDDLAQPLSPYITEIITQAFPAFDSRYADIDNHIDQEDSAAARSPSADSIFSQEAYRAADAPRQLGLAQYQNHSPEPIREPPPAYHFQQGQVTCQAPGGHIIARLIAQRIAAQPHWSITRNGRPSAPTFQSFTLITSISPSCTFSEFKRLLTPKLKAKVLEYRRSGARPGETVKAWVYVQWREPGTRFMGLRKGKLRAVDVRESNWATIVAALRDRTFVGDLRVVFWNEVPMTEAQKREQEAVSQIFRSALRPYGHW